MSLFSHNCIKCQEVYEDTDPDPYYCRTCNEQRILIAKEVDAKHATRISKKPAMSDLQMYDEIRKARGVQFVNIKDMGISL